MKTFVLHRVHDVSGVSGTGIIAEGVQLSNGKVVISWFGKHQSTVVWDNIDSVEAIHGHNGLTKIVWSDHSGDPTVYEAKAPASSEAQRS